MYFKSSIMDLRKDIKKATLLNFKDDKAKFFRLQQESQAEKDRKMNERKMKKPRNLNLLEDFDGNDRIDNSVSDNVTSTFDKHAISAAIKEVNGGLDLSNKHWEETWFKHVQDLNNSTEEISREQNDIKAHFRNKPEVEDLNEKLDKYKYKFLKNAAIMGLVKTKKISLNDLISSNNENSTRKENELKALDKTLFNVDNSEYQIEAVPHHEVPDVFVHPLQLGIDVTKFQDIDFTIPRVGKKTEVTPREYFLMKTDDAFFNFVKKRN